MIKVVLDTNVFISGIFWPGNYCSQIIDLWKNEKIRLISSIEIIQELIETLKEFKIQLTQEKILEWEKEILSRSYIVEPSKKFTLIKDDPDDNKFIDAAVAGRVRYIISQDKHLLKIKDLGYIKIVKPEEFLKEYNKLKKKLG